jgi:hypothetical protein
MVLHLLAERRCPSRDVIRGANGDLTNIVWKQKKRAFFFFFFYGPPACVAGW